ncbi:LOW QUALITY PROTEIN: proline-rich protein 36-like [Lontra canadensis]|uniref:LOW QUALITY PROTEIN: proline-rich protein 36-like n=1 Tax=Lontra canadensis TaxID=76717 RepID=UPI0013F378EE|nr:LOW QUALITY PROTEIN: proline-rich protein 36-like [Lontra canadensis]
MELSRNSVETRKPTGLGRCRHFFWLGVVFDTVGATLLFTGVFARLLFYDLLLYLGSIIIFFSLLWWVFWYTGNIELTVEESLKEPFHVPSSTSVNALSQRLSHTLCNVSRSLTRIRRRCAPRTFLLRSASLSMTGTARPENQLQQEDQGKDAAAGAQESGDAQNLGSEDLGPKPEAVVSSEGVRSPGPGAGSLGAEAGLPGPVKGSFFTHMVTPEFPPSPPDQPQPLAVLSSRSLPVLPSASTRQPLALCVSRSQHVATLASAGQSAASLASTSPPLLTVASESQPAVPLSSMTQPTVVLASQNQPFVPVASWDHSSVSLASQVHNLVPVPAQSNLQILLASQSHLPVSAAAQSHLQVPLASQSQLENIPLASQTSSSGAQAPQSEGLAPPGSLIQVPTSQSFQAQPVNLRMSLAVQDFQAFYHNQQTLQSISSVQEISSTQSAPVQEFQKKPVAQAFETLPPVGQELSQEFSATSSPPPESQAPASQAQQSVSPESTTAPASEMKSSRP